jgi:hypothetical protein
LYFPEDQEVIKWEEENEATLKDFGLSEEEETFTPPKTGPGVTVGGEQGIELTDPGK